MTDLRKAAKQALEVLETTWGNGHEDTLKLWEETIEALHQALNVDSVNMSQELVDETEKREREPVGFFSINDYGNWEENENGYGEPLYTAPPKREWVGLSDGEYDELLKGDWGGSLIQRVEAKLKEKNV